MAGPSRAARAPQYTGLWRQLRGACQSARAQCQPHSGTARNQHLAGQHDESVLQHRLRMADAVAGDLQLRDSEDRRPVQWRVSEQAWCIARGQLGRSASTVAAALGRAPAGNVPNCATTSSRPDSTATGSTSSISRVGKILKFGRTRTLVSADLYNALNSSAVRRPTTTHTFRTARGCNRKPS